jgi:sugar (pentulose or hexulose) kinase
LIAANNGLILNQTAMTGQNPIFLALDLGTTHCKAGLFAAEGGECLQVASRPTPVSDASQGFRYISPNSLWEKVAEMLVELSASPDAGCLAAIGIAGMAESGLLVDRRSGEARSVIFPWFDTAAGAVVDSLRQAGDVRQRFLATGIYPSFKCSLAKILWARQYLGIDLNGALWLSAPDFIAFQLSGAFGTDYSLAGRTYAFQVYAKVWDEGWLRTFDLPTGLFPPALPAGLPVGRLRAGVARQLHLPAGIPVSIAGHDHICAALAVGATRPGVVLDSMGTAEVLCGAFAEKPLGEAELKAGFSFGCHTAPGQFYWMGGLSTSGGALEWLSGLWPGRGLSYPELEEALAGIPAGPGEILFFPYLAGSGAPHSFPKMRAALVGLDASHHLGHLVRAVLEGTAYEVEFMRRGAVELAGKPIERVIAAGGGVRNQRWLQIKADVSGCRYELAPTPEAVLMGAAMIAGVGAGVYRDVSEAMTATARPAGEVYLPDAARHERYQRIYEENYMPLQEALRAFYRDRS